MIQPKAGEKWKEIEMPKGLRFRYAVSNQGRVASFTEKVEDGKLVKGSAQDGYRIMRLKIKYKGKMSYHHFFFHHLIAAAFVKNRNPKKYTHIIHKDYNRGNNLPDNLEWTTKTEMHSYSNKSPKAVAARKKRLATFSGYKLNEKDVLKIKSLLDEGKTLRKIAEQFGVSDMQIFRIKKGLNWSHIKPKKK